MRSRKMLSLNLTASVCILLAAALCAPQHALGQYAISTVAGGGPNNLPALQSSIGFAVSVAQDTAGNFYISDSYSSQVFKVSTAGTLTVVAGNGTIGYSGDGGVATSAQLSMPEGIAIDGSGNIFIADTGNSVIREVVAGTGNIQTVAGNFSLGAGYSGDGGPATSAQLNDPYGVSVDSAGNIFIADTSNSVIREVATGSGNIQTVAGSATNGAGYSGDGGIATSAQLNLPEGIFLDGTGNIFIADTNNSVIRAVNTGSAAVTIAGIAIPAGDIQTVAGTNYDSGFGSACMFTGSGGLATSAYLCEPVGVFVDASENIFIADTDNYAIREVGTTGTLTTVAGTPGTFGYSGDGGLATSAVLNYSSGVVVDGAGNIYIADSDNFVVREVTAADGNIQAFAGNNTLAYSGDGGPATGAALNFPGGVFTDSSGNIYIADTNSSVIRVVNPGTQAVTIAGVTIQPSDIQTIAGTGIACLAPTVGGCGDGGPPTSAALNYPFGIFVDGSGNIFIADTGLPLTESSAIRVINPGTAPITIAGVTIQPGTIQTVVGTLGTAGFAGDGGLPTSARLFNPQDVVVDGSGNIYISDSENSAIRVVNSGTQALTIAGVTIQPGSIQTVAGTPPTACADPSSGCGDNAAASSASLNFPGAISLDAAGNIYIADTFNSAIRVVNSGTQAITIAGTTIPPADILTVAGTIGRDGYSGDAGAPNAALLNTPWGVSVDPLGNIFIADTNNSAIREVVAVDATIQTIAGTGTAGFSGDGGSATSAMLDGPQSVVLSGAGNLLIADSQSSRIRQLVSTVSVSVVPASATVAMGLTQQFLATVTGASNANVTWQVNGATGGNATVGTISTAGLYQAPSTAPASAVTVTAISDANGTTSGSASVTIAASGAPAISVSTNPSGVTVVYTATTQAFTASVTGESNTAVTWEVNGTAGDSTNGTIDSTGLYSAPSAVPSQPLVIITAVSQADPTVSGSYPITIVIAPAATQPAPQTISPGGTANFSISLNPNTGNPHNPITLSCLQSSLPTGASCTFSPAIITPGSSAVPFSLAISVPSTGASLQQHQSTWLATQLWWSFSPLAGILLLTGKRKKSHLRWMSLAMFCLLLVTLVGCGGSSKSTSQNPVTYNIQVQGQTAAQPNPVPITVVTLTVQ